MAQWDQIQDRGTVEDRRSMSPVVGGVSIAGVALFLLFNYLQGGSLLDGLLQVGNQVIQQPQVQESTAPINSAYKDFASEVLGSNDTFWTKEFAESKLPYEKPKLVLFRGGTDSACGGALSQYGPHYCPEDATVYLDETFFDEMKMKFGAKGGDVAEAYVMAHEVGHHVQSQLGIMQKAQRTLQSTGNNQYSIALELQADCLAGMWVRSVQNQGIVNAAEVPEAIDAARSVGDDRIQKQATGRVNPEQWTHGSSAERVKWFNEGYTTGNFDKCNTFDNLNNL